MSLLCEQYNSLKMTRQFLTDLLDTKKRPKNVTELKKRALRCLRHYPFLRDNGQPIWSKNED